MPLAKCREMLAKKEYARLIEYCRKQRSTRPDESIYAFYEAAAHIYLGDFGAGKGLLLEIYKKEGKPIYLIMLAMVYFVEGDAKSGGEALDRAIEAEEDIGGLVLIFSVAVDEMLLGRGEKAVRKAIGIDREKTVGLVREYFEELASDERLTPKDRLEMMGSLNLFEELLKRA